MARGERLEAVVEAQLVGRRADLKGAETEDGVVDRSGTGEAAGDQVRAGAADHHLGFVS